MSYISTIDTQARYFRTSRRFAGEVTCDEDSCQNFDHKRHRLIAFHEIGKEPGPIGDHTVKTVEATICI